METRLDAAGDQGKTLEACVNRGGSPGEGLVKETHPRGQTWSEADNLFKPVSSIAL